MFGVEYLIDKLNTAINSGTLTDLQMAQASGAIDVLENKSVVSVATFNDLPNPVLNKGRFIYIVDENRYVFSDGVTWDINNIIGAPDAKLYAWGNSFFGRLGDGTTVDKSSPVSVVGGFTDWIQVSGGNIHSLGVRGNGTAWAWGSNTDGEIGDGTTVDKSSPVSVAGGFTDWVQVSGGSSFSLGLRANGTAWAWGDASQGSLGNNSTVGRSSPVSVVGGFTDWIQVAAGQFHSLGVRANGVAYAWGNNELGRLGDGTVVNKSSPVLVIGGFTDWVQVDGGNNAQSHSLGLRANGTAWGWGNNYSGQLGNNSIVFRSSPVSVVGGFTDWVQVSAGDNLSLGLRANGTLWAWGYNNRGGLGNNSTVNRSSPVSVVGGFTDWVQVSSEDHNLGVRANGTAWAWGGNNDGCLGDNTEISRSSPVSVVGGFTDWIQVSTGGGLHSFGIRG